MENLSRFVLSHRIGVLASWAFVLCVAVPLSSRLPSVIHGSTDAIRASESEQVTQAIQQKFGRGAAYVFPVVMESRDISVEDPRYPSAVRNLENTLREVGRISSARHFWNTGSADLLGRDRRTALMLLQSDVGTFFEAENLIATLRASITQAGLPDGFSAKVTGTTAMFHDLNRNSSADLLRAEAIGVPLTLFILLLAFGAPLAAGLALLIAFTAVTVSSAGLYLLSTWEPVSVFAQNVITMIGLGVGVDYALFILYRYRKELAQGKPIEEAVVNACNGAGPAILVSGIAVGVGFLSLYLVHADFLHSMALGGLLVVTSAIAATLTLLPVVLHVLGERVNWPTRTKRDSRFPHRFNEWWTPWTHFVMGRPLPCLIPALIVLVLLIAPVLRMNSWNVAASDLPLELESRQGFQLLEKNFEKGWMGPVVLLLEAGARGNLWSEDHQGAVRAIASRLSRDPRVARVQGYPRVLERLGEGRYQIRSRSQLPPPLAALAADSITSDGKAALLVLVPRLAPESRGMMEFMRELRADSWEEARAAGITIRVGGATSVIFDFDAELFGSLWRVVPAVLAVTFVMLLVFFRSLVIPLKAVVVNLCSVLAAYGFLVLIFQDGIGAQLLGITVPGGLNSFIVLMLFTILFGLSMDYEVFLLRQIQEEYLGSGDNSASVALGLQRSAGLITSAAAIMVCLFGSFGFTRLTATREFGLGLAFAVALDATMIRLLIVPASMALLGDANWWLPALVRHSSERIAVLCSERFEKLMRLVFTRLNWKPWIK